jgi:YVTN family beta-propeller protein
MRVLLRTATSLVCAALGLLVAVGAYALAPPAHALPGPPGFLYRPLHAVQADVGPMEAAAPTPEPFNVYAGTLAGMAPQLQHLRPRVYVPNSNSNTVTVIDPLTFNVIDRFWVGNIPHHVSPAPDMSALYVGNEGSSNLTVLDIESGRPVRTIPVTFPYNLYFTPDGQKAVVVAERLRRLEFWDPRQWIQLRVVNIPWPGADHLDFTRDGHYLFVSTEYSGQVVRVDVDRMELAGSVAVGGLPVDVRLAPDGRVLYVANQGRGGVSVIDPDQMRELQFIPTGAGAHGLQVSRDTHQLYVTNRLAGTVSVIDFDTRQVVASWRVGGSPDMTQLSPDGSQLWMSSRFDGAVIVVDTTDGHVLTRIPTGAGAHGLTYFPNAGQISLGHNGVYIDSSRPPQFLVWCRPQGGGGDAVSHGPLSVNPRLTPPPPPPRDGEVSRLRSPARSISAAPRWCPRRSR